MEAMAERPRTAGWPLLRVTPSSANQELKALPPPAVTAAENWPSSLRSSSTPGESGGTCSGVYVKAGLAGLAGASMAGLVAGLTVVGGGMFWARRVAGAARVARQRKRAAVSRLIRRIVRLERRD